MDDDVFNEWVLLPVISRIWVTLQSRCASRRIFEGYVVGELFLVTLISYTMFILMCRWTTHDTVNDVMRNK
jgi:hypothetical protein